MSINNAHKQQKATRFVHYTYTSMQTHMELMSIYSTVVKFLRNTRYTRPDHS